MTGTEFDLDKFVQVAGDAIVAANPDGAITFWNPAAERIFGYTKSEERALRKRVAELEAKNNLKLDAGDPNNCPAR